MTICINQPLYFPYGGFFQKLSMSDVCVILDDVKYTKGDFVNRNRIKTPNGNLWLTVPVKVSENSKINEVKICHERNWIRKHLGSIEMNYKRAEFFSELFPLFKSFYQNKYRDLISLNMDSIRLVLDYYGITKKIVFSSNLNIRSSSTQRLVDICNAIGGDSYVSGVGAKSYMDEQLFSKYRIKLVYQNYEQAIIKKYHKKVECNLSIIDMLFHLGRSGYIMLNGWS